ncbi:Transposase [Vibrio scophthalmi LMG 19158]|uniref:Mutator family transposase n=1 Tax=Vibrio scophthalmi LMG 19158 TaxID=870967 RepID=F9RTH7_9VIBR|nr:Transposase [Vibrio scophthalmi LMG 19158]
MTITADLKIYQATTEDEALLALEYFGDKWDKKYTQISRPSGRLIETISILCFDIRKAIYTTNAIESLSSVIRNAIKNHKLFPADESA